jgi:hypothetical protein
VKFVDPLPDQEGLLKEESSHILYVLFPCEIFSLVFVHLETENLSDQDYDLLYLSVYDLYPTHGELCVYLIGFVSIQVK